jgi:putative endonuclease
LLERPDSLIGKVGDSISSPCYYSPKEVWGFFYYQNPESFDMTFFVYIIYSEITNKYYVGHTDDLERRLTEHNTSQTRYTQTGKPWVLKYTETFESRSQATQREREIKGKKSRKYIEALISSAG